jgi:hypothetical protein
MSADWPMSRGAGARRLGTTYQHEVTMNSYRITMALAAMHRSELIAEASRARLIREAHATATPRHLIGERR